MSDTRIISQSDINALERAVDRLNDVARSMRGVVHTVSATAADLDDSIDTIKAEFDAFREFDTEQKELAIAKTRIVDVRQQLKEKFGINDDVRQYLTGILEASDLTLVRERIITNCTERIMISCPEYWLAPCLVAISAWLGDDKALADKALREAMKRDDEKTSLLFALICRRVGRMNASAVWLDRYLALQDPHNIERKMVTVLDAYSNGLFGQQARESCTLKIDAWIDELMQEPGFVETQQESWESSMMAMIKGQSFSNRYPYASRYAENWSACNATINDMDLHQTLLEYFSEIFDRPSASNASLNAKLDELLETYISSYDNAELPLRREERMLTLIIEEKGRKARAQARFDAERKAMEEIIDFTQLLTSAAMHADVIKASASTQRLAIALSKDWIIPAYNNVVLQLRSRVPGSFEINVEGWKASLHSGDEEAALCSKAETYFNNRRDAAIENVRQSKWDMIAPIGVGVIGLLSMFASPPLGIVALLGAGGLGIRWFMNKKNCETQRENIRRHYDEVIEKVKDVVRALCAERVDYAAEVAQKDAVSAQTGEYLENIQVGQYVSTGGLRTVMAE